MSYGNETRHIGTFASEPLANAALDAAVAVFAAEPSQGRSAEEVDAIVTQAKEAAMNDVVQMSPLQENETMIHCMKVQDGGELVCGYTYPKPFAYSKLRYAIVRGNGGAWKWRTDCQKDCKKCGRHREWAPTVNEHSQRLENEAKGFAN